MERESFIFYRSFYEAIRDLPDNIRLEVFTAITEYALYGKLPENLKPFARGMFTLVKPNLDVNITRYENGMKGGRKPKKGSSSPSPASSGQAQAPAAAPQPAAAPHASAGLSQGRAVPKAALAGLSQGVTHPSPPAPYTATLQDEVAEMLANDQWKESVCIRYSLSIDQIDFYLKDFALKCKKERHTSLQDAKSNFCYWLQKQKLKQTIKQNIQAQSKDNYTYNGGFGGEDV